VYGFIRAAEHGWSDSLTIGSLVAAVVLLAAFVVIEQRARQPILPFRLFAERNRALGFLNQLLVPATLFGVFFFLTQYLQIVLDLSAVQSGFAFVPFSATIVLGARFVPRAVARFGARVVGMYGGLAIAAGLVLMSTLDESAAYFPMVFLSMLVMASGAVASFVSLSLVVMGNISQEDSGSASGLMQTNQQVGGAIGLAVLVTVFGTASRNAAADGSNEIQSMVAGMQQGFLVAAGIALIVFLVAALGFRNPRSGAN
jgi:predicted MFS family arabinose efflux permease